MSIQQLSTLYDYNYWANERILSRVAELTDSQFFAATSHSAVAEPVEGHSLHQTLVHTLGAEWIWRMRSAEGVSPKALLKPDELPTLSAIRACWREEEQKMRAFVAGLSDDDLNRTICYRSTEGNMRENLLGDILHHVVLHGMQHRSEMAAMLTDFGHSPGNIDFIVFLR